MKASNFIQHINRQTNKLLDITQQNESSNFPFSQTKNDKMMPVDHAKSHDLPPNIHFAQQDRYEAQKMNEAEKDIISIYGRTKTQKSYQLGSETQDLLLSSKSLQSERSGVKNSSICSTHNKNLDILCVVDKIKICSHCALFGQHKDHTFKSQAQLFKEVEEKYICLKKLEQTHQLLDKSNYLDQQWKYLQNQLKSKQQLKLIQLEKEYKSIVDKLSQRKQQIQIQVHNQYLQIINKLKQQAEKCRKEIRFDRTFDRWIYSGKEILELIKSTLNQKSFNNCYKDYQNFDWNQGEIIVESHLKFIQRLKDQIKQSTKESNNNFGHSLLQSLFNSFFAESEIKFNLNSCEDTSITSIDDLSKNTSFWSRREAKQLAQNQFINIRQAARVRHSQCLETILEPIFQGQKSCLRNSKQARQSVKLFAFQKPSNSSKKQNKPINSLNLSINQRKKSKSRLEATFLSPKTGTRFSYKSPEQFKTKSDPLKIVKEFEKNPFNSQLNLSDCQLTDDSMLYFVEKVINCHKITFLSLQRNKITNNGLAKLLPLLFSCKSVNLAKTGLGQGCLDLLLRYKGTKLLQQLNLMSNGINSKRNAHKLEQLKKMGLRVICD